MQYQDLSKEQLIEICQHFDKSLETIAAGLNSAIVAKFGDEFSWEPSDLHHLPEPDWNPVSEMREEANSCLHYVNDSMTRRWTNNELTIQVCRDYYAFPATQPKFALGRKVLVPDDDRRGVIIAIGSDSPAFEWIYFVCFKFNTKHGVETKEYEEVDLLRMFQVQH